MLLHDSPQSLVLKLSVPAIIGMVVVGLYNFMDGVYVGQMVGDNAMAAVSVSYPFTLANSGIYAHRYRLRFNPIQGDWKKGSVYN